MKNTKDQIMAQPKGFLVVPVGFDVLGDPHALDLDANNYLKVIDPTLSTLLGDLTFTVGDEVKISDADTHTVLNKLQFDASNYLKVYDMSGSPRGARITRTTDQSIASGGYVAISFNSEIFDVGGCCDLVANPTRITCVQAGYYAIFGNVSFTAHATGRRIVAVKYNGGSYIAIVDLPNNGAYATKLCVSTLYQLAVDDYIELFVYQNSGGGLDVDTLGDYSPIFAMFKWD